MATAGHVIGHHGDRHCHPVLATRRLPGFYSTSIAVLAFAGAVCRMLREPDTTRENVAVTEEMDLSDSESVILRQAGFAC